jgi:hypothetical protein
VERTGCAVEAGRRTDASQARVVPSAATIDFQWLPAIGYQSYGNCGAWPSAYYQKTYYEAREHGWVRPSPAVVPRTRHERRLRLQP